MTTNFYYKIQGEGPPMVFLHGSFATTSTWKFYTAALSANHQCISIKLPGHGGAPDPQDFTTPSIEEELSLITKVIRDNCDQPIHLIGHSYGAVVALSLALKHSVNIKQLSLFEPVAAQALNTVGSDDKFEQIKTFVAQYQQAVSQQQADACKLVIDFWGGENAFDSLPESIQQSMQTMTANNIRHWDICMSTLLDKNTLSNLNTPTQIICGDQSNPLLRDIASSLCQHIPRAYQQIIPGASHFLVTSHAQACLDYLLSPKKP